ncbi:hypothetical protein PF005_g18952 [Phytophthora fragariae]|uniref:Uncharacterized protein n=2 Tax=Phytophthora TaxID=4783 RepID=A0A6A3JBD6_9STRA|nr:hypothetical protein PF003_g39697 [Phytophthora fragariae]KAE9033938.1 hypothetical protein PR002_g8406 [Phytophthora rubi]KAE8929946.1 hypothetical protein PF009_g19955 [Phytophthora fragariae]KAE8991512.1 hypothetical protein PF011_g17920 [Phytophthora fragariae]KAE9091021.1 hypothetical protein PF010_g18361 [Phytophthora fragariae]
MEQNQWTPVPTHGPLRRHEAAAQQRALQLEQARQNHQISPDDYNRQLHLSSFSYLANVMALRRHKMQAQQTQFQRSMY